MPRMQRALLVSLLCSLISASPTARPTSQPNPSAVVEYPPDVTPFRVLNEPTRTRLQPRANILSKIESGLTSALSHLGADIPSFIASGVPRFLHDLPHGSAIESSLGIASSQLAALPTEVLNLPPYANWTDQGWNVRFHGNVYKQPNTTQEKLNQLANVFLIGVDINSLPPDQQAQARNVTAEIFIAQQGQVSVSMHLQPAPENGTNAGGVPPPGNAVQDLTLPYLTTGEGDFDVFVPIQGNGLLPGNATQKIQKLNIYANGSSLGNATAYLVPPTGFTVISDIDDILRVTKIYLPKEGILNTFARPFVPWLNMPDIYAGWSRTLPNTHFHYLTTTPEQATRNYMDFIFKTYPLGSFDTRPLNFSNVAETLGVRKYLLDIIFQTFPQRKFILVADTSNSDVMKDYPLMAKNYPGQVQCIFLRNTSATDKDYLPYDTSGFKGLNQSNYMFFITPDDLTGLDIAGGNCYNSSIKQNVTFGTQDELLGIHGSAAVSLQAHVQWAGIVASFVALFFFIL